MPRFLAQFLARIIRGRPPGDETACGSRGSPYSGNYRRYLTPPAPACSALNGTGGVSTADTHHTTTDHELRTNDEPAELPSRPTL